MGKETDKDMAVVSEVVAGKSEAIHAKAKELTDLVKGLDDERAFMVLMVGTPRPEDGRYDDCMGVVHGEGHLVVGALCEFFERHEGLLQAIVMQSLLRRSSGAPEETGIGETANELPL